MSENRKRYTFIMETMAYNNFVSIYKSGDYFSLFFFNTRVNKSQVK